MQHVDAGEPGADHNDVKGLVAPAGEGLQGRHHFLLPWILLLAAASILPGRAKAQGPKRLD
jgi:hypothetical protein